MVEQTLWTSYTPAVTNANDSQQYALGTNWYAVVPGWSLGAKWRFPDTLPTGSVTAKLWRVDGDDTQLASGVELASATFVSPVAGAVNEVRWSTPIVIDANLEYNVSIKTADRYVASPGYDPFDLGGTGITSGDLRAPANGSDPIGLGTLHNGVLNDLTGHQFPYQTFSNSNYWVDVIFTTDDPTGATPSSSDAGTVTDAATVAASATGTDTGTGTQNQTLSTSLTSADTAALSQNQTLTTTLSGTDTGTGANNQTLAASASGIDQGTVAEGQTVSATGTGSDAGALSEGWSLVVSHASSDSGTGSDDEEPPTFMSSDSGTLIETQALLVGLSSSDSANLIEVGIRQIEGEAGEVPQYPITIIHRTPGVTIRRVSPGVSVYRELPGITIRG